MQSHHAHPTASRRFCGASAAPGSPSSAEAPAHASLRRSSAPRSREVVTARHACAAASHPCDSANSEGGARRVRSSSDARAGGSGARSFPSTLPRSRSKQTCRKGPGKVQERSRKGAAIEVEADLAETRRDGEREDAAVDQVGRISAHLGYIRPRQSRGRRTGRRGRRRGRGRARTTPRRAAAATEART